MKLKVKNEYILRDCGYSPGEVITPSRTNREFVYIPNRRFGLNMWQAELCLHLSSYFEVVSDNEEVSCI